MREFSITAQSLLLYIRLSSNNIVVNRYRVKDTAPGIEELSLLGSWQLIPTNKHQASITQLKICQMIQKATGEDYNEVIGAIFDHKIQREQGDSASNPTHTPSPKTDGFISQKLKAASMSVSQLLRKPRQK